MKMWQMVILASILTMGRQAAGQKTADWDTEIGQRGATLSVEIRSPLRYVISPVLSYGATTQYDPIDGTQVQKSISITVGKLSISVRAYNEHGQQVVPIHIAVCPNNTRRFSMSQGEGGNACANLTEATVTISLN